MKRINIAGSEHYHIYKDDRGWVNIEHIPTRTITRVQDENFKEFAMMISKLDKWLDMDKERQRKKELERQKRRESL